MKIIIGSSTFGNYHRQNIAVDSWKHLANEFDCVECVDIQLKGEASHDYGIPSLTALDRHSGDFILDSKRRLPFVNDVLKVILTMDCDYFIYVNSDVIINGNLIKHIMNNEPGSFACSRLDIQHIDSFSQVLDKKVTPVRYEIAGFDAFIFKRSWMQDNIDLFQDYLIGQPHWDQSYATIIKIFGGNEPFGNNYPPFCFHIKHEMTWQLGMSVERAFNCECSKRPLDSLSISIFNDYLDRVLIKRQPYGTFINPVENEGELELDFFSKYL